MHTATKTKEEFLLIEGKLYQWEHARVSGAQLRDLANLNPNVEVYMAVCPPGKDELVQNTDVVDLGRGDIESFYVKQPLFYTLNGVSYKSDRQFIRGRQLRHEGQVPADQHIYLINKGPWEDELILDEDWVDLARPGTEHFVSRPEKVDIALIVNGREKPWHDRHIIFEEVVRLAYPNYNPSGEKVYTVLYKKGPIQNPEGSMVEGQSVRVKNKMVFNVTETTRS